MANTPNWDMFAKLDENDQIVRPPHNDGNHFNVHHDLTWLTEHGFEEHTQQWFDDHTPVPPEPVPPTSPEFESACAQFRDVCAQIGQAASIENFKGGFDEMVEFQQSAVYNTLQGVQLAVAWSASNELCKYEGGKIGYGQPQWWYRCWELAEQNG